MPFHNYEQKKAKAVFFKEEYDLKFENTRYRGSSMDEVEFSLSKPVPKEMMQDLAEACEVSLGSFPWGGSMSNPPRLDKSGRYWGVYTGYTD